MTSWAIISILLAAGFAFWRIGRRTRFFLHMMQLSGYRVRPFSEFLRGKLFDVRLRLSHGLGALWLILVLGLKPEGDGWLILLGLLWAFTFASSRRYRRDRPKKNLAWTARMKRLTGVTVLLLLLPVLLTALITSTVQDLSTVFTFAGWLVGLWLADLGAPEAVRLAARLTTPFERRIHDGFKAAAEARLAERTDLYHVAITGSYGKTSVKHAIRAVLAQRYPVLMTPGSYNTPMGISKVINDQLGDDHRFLVLEMGMRHPGDIAELAVLAPPDIAVITSIGVAHLESMGSIEAIACEKLTLLDHIREGGTAVLNGDDVRVASATTRKDVKRIVVATTPGTADLWAENIQYGAEGAVFDVVDRSGDRLQVATRLLGQHNVLNILLALGVGRAAGLRLRQAVHGITHLDPVPHRLALRIENGVNVIDDAFNANPVGTKHAVDVLSAFDRGRRVIITPGMIELGEEESALNKAFGIQIASAADDAILVGPERTLPIKEGLLEAGFKENQIHTVTTLFEAQEWVAQHCKPGDTVLYENDLPDQFTEGGSP